MSVSGWIFMVGFRVVDVGLLLGWLFWFFHRLLDDEGDDEDDRRDGWDEPTPQPPAPPSGPAMRPWPVRLRDHGDRRPRTPVRRADRTAEPRPRVPA